MRTGAWKISFYCSNLDHFPKNGNLDDFRENGNVWFIIDCSVADPDSHLGI